MSVVDLLKGVLQNVCFWATFEEILWKPIYRFPNVLESSAKRSPDYIYWTQLIGYFGYFPYFEFIALLVMDGIYF